jgi:elongator complex protein 4
LYTTDAYFYLELPHSSLKSFFINKPQDLELQQMSFRKRATPLSNTSKQPSVSSSATGSNAQSSLGSYPGIRSHPALSLLTTSTGTSSLDNLLNLSGGLALGHSLAIFEHGTTDYAGALLRCFASQGVVLGQKVFIGALEAWGTNLPGVKAEKEKSKARVAGSIGKEVERGERMKIAWRYERLGLEDGDAKLSTTPFSHNFDLMTKLERPAKSLEVTYLPTRPLPTLDLVVSYLKENTGTPVRLVLPSLLSPLLYPPQASQNLLPYLHQLRSLLRAHENLVVIISWPLELYHQSSTLTRWLERLVDGVVTLEAFPHGFSFDSEVMDDSKRKEEDTLQGFLRVRKLPAITERGIGIGSGDEMMFSMSKRSFTIRPYNLPPLDGGAEEKEEDQMKKSELEF